ncbi:hypothetical protein BWQ96_07676 [Gracilariopsis chorda]|uniref:Pherophorin domain-containing protein n=1 Tax=Gracilariopsis chorda TaxID=448386 RepID=A0A2V3IKJ1_9FLOR|nr:hypothetical protein BWQ96_07676 [Gracilariopsis chorda]|eukprot:PXF42581.1 hypothetical protein BWQ96_07676 [Gracilariopsis chorda]
MRAQYLFFAAWCIVLLHLNSAVNISDAAVINISMLTSLGVHAPNRGYYHVYPVKCPSKSSPTSSFAIPLPTETPSTVPYDLQDEFAVSTPEPDVSRTPPLQQFTTGPPLVSVPRGVVRNSFIFRTSEHCGTICRAYVQSALLSNPVTTDCKVNSSSVNIGRVNLGFVRCPGTSGYSTLTGFTISTFVVEKTIRPTLTDLNITLLDVESDRSFRLQ